MPGDLTLPGEEAHQRGIGFAVDRGRSDPDPESVADPPDKPVATAARPQPQTAYQHLIAPAYRRLRGQTSTAGIGIAISRACRPISRNRGERSIPPIGGITRRTGLRAGSQMLASTLLRGL